MNLRDGKAVNGEAPPRVTVVDGLALVVIAGRKPHGH